MIAKNSEKKNAIKLRKEGFSYSEILKEIPVAKSTLSLWLRSVGLAKEQKQRLTQKKLDAALRGAMARNARRLKISKDIKDRARCEVNALSSRELWLIGISLYWGEGCKERKKGHIVRLDNSDPYLIKIFLKWLFEICKLPKQDIHFRIYLHETSADRLKAVQKYWADATGYSIDNFQKITWKKNQIKTKRKNIGDNYYGLLSVSVKRSINFNRKIQGWIEGIYQSCRVV